jgi:hypothetical protein
VRKESEILGDVPDAPFVDWQVDIGGAVEKLVSGKGDDAVVWSE